MEETLEQQWCVNAVLWSWRAQASSKPLFFVFMLGDWLHCTHAHRYVSTCLNHIETHSSQHCRWCADTSTHIYTSKHAKLKWFRALRASYCSHAPTNWRFLLLNKRSKHCVQAFLIKVQFRMLYCLESFLQQFDMHPRSKKTLSFSPNIYFTSPHFSKSHKQFVWRFVLSKPFLCVSLFCSGQMAQSVFISLPLTEFVVN